MRNYLSDGKEEGYPETTKCLTSVPRQELPHPELSWEALRKPIRTSMGNVTTTDIIDMYLILRF